MIRQFRDGVWIDPELVVGVEGTEEVVIVNGLAEGKPFVQRMRCDDALRLADEIGAAALIAQEARLAAESRSLADE